MDNCWCHLPLNPTNGNLNYYPDAFLFNGCCKSLERVSIRDIDWRDDSDDEEQKLIFTQNTLIKKFRNVPTLHWFRSDLTPDNMTMLRLERPGIELLN
jgi:hypothetical protein